MYRTYITLNTIQIFYSRHFRKGYLWSPQFITMAKSNCAHVWVTLTSRRYLPLPKHAIDLSGKRTLGREKGESPLSKLTANNRWVRRKEEARSGQRKMRKAGTGEGRRGDRPPTKWSTGQTPDHTGSPVPHRCGDERAQNSFSRASRFFHTIPQQRPPSTE